MIKSNKIDFDFVVLRRNINEIINNSDKALLFQYLWDGHLSDINKDDKIEEISRILLLAYRFEFNKLLTTYLDDAKYKDYRKYIDAHNGEKDKVSFDIAFKEIQNNCLKERCWIWYIFPQPKLKNITQSPISLSYSLETSDVSTYLDIKQLKDNYISIVTVLQKCIQTHTLSHIVAGDDKAVKSSLQSFREATEDINKHQDVHTLCTDTLELMN